jgi:hypothetical protein
LILTFLDKDKKLIGDVKIGWGQYLYAYSGRYGEVGDGATFTIPEDSNAAYLDVHLCQMNECGEGNFNYYYDLQLEEGPAVTEYEPYKETKISTSHILNGIPVESGGNYTDANGQQWICDEIDFERGVHVQRIGHRVLDGTNIRPYYATHSNGQHYCAIYPGDIATNSRAMSSNYAFVPINWSDTNLTLYGIGGAIIINDSRFNSADDVVSLWSDELPKVYYVLATPIETPLTAEELEAFKALKTNYPHTTVLNDAGAHMELTYNADTKTYLDRLPKATDEQVEAAVTTWLEAHFASAEGVSF